MNFVTVPSGSYFEQCINMHFSFIIPLAFSSGVVPFVIYHYIAPGPQPLVYLKFFLLSSLNIWEHTHTHIHTHSAQGPIILRSSKTVGEMRCQSNIYFRPLLLLINFFPQYLCFPLSLLSPLFLRGLFLPRI